MSSTNPEHSTDPEQNLTPAEIEDLGRLEATAQRRLGSYLMVGNALGEIRDRHLYRAGHPSFEAYVKERWGLPGADGAPLSQATVTAGAQTTPPPGQAPDAPRGSKACESLARACEETLAALEGDERLGIEIRLAVRRHGGGELLPTLRWLLSQATGTIGEVSHRLETYAADIDEHERAQLREDVLVLDEELVVIKALLIELHDWDSELGRLLDDELPPFDTYTDPDDDE